MSIKPILFNTEMVKAILDGRKTQTRRLVKEILLHAPYFELCDGTPYACDMYGEWHPAERFCRIQPGDILWVRETWAHGYIERSDVEGSSEAWFEESAVGCGGYIGAISSFMYRADAHDYFGETGVKWHPSIHMPKEAARIFLRVKNVRVERLQDITVLDAINEGCCGTICDHAGANPELGCTDCYNTGWLEAPDVEFALLWDTTVKKIDIPVYGWEANPWVWVIEFEHCEKPEGWPTCR